MELTPELFETIEFTERRKGYDTEEVETFLEEAGTALAQLLARHRQLEQAVA
ncbi:MAG: DivIVA domain-containing protein, partial [Actinomycetota bacterium]